MSMKQQIFEHGIKTMVKQGDLSFTVSENKMGKDYGVSPLYRKEVTKGKVFHCIIGANIDDLRYTKDIESKAVYERPVYEKLLDLKDYRDDSKGLEDMLKFLEKLQECHDSICICFYRYSPKARLKAFLGEAAEVGMDYGIDLSFYNQFPKNLTKGIQI